jgi:hypothetical protein
MTNEQLKQQLESLIDRNSLATVLQAMSEICYEKEEHIEANWQDKNLSKIWASAGTRIERVLKAVDC